MERESLISRVNGETMICGRLALPSLSELRERLQSHKHARGKISVEEVVEDIQTLHTDVTHAGSLFQVASQQRLPALSTLACGIPHLDEA